MNRVAFIVACLALAVAVPVVANADHVPEPTAPIVDATLRLENYADNFPTDCQGSALRPKVRIEHIAYNSEEAFRAGNPSEHFNISWRWERRSTNPKTGAFIWVDPQEIRWPHSNIRPHNESPKFNVGYATTAPGEPNGGSFITLAPGYYRFTASLLTDESAQHFVRVCEFTISAA